VKAELVNKKTEGKGTHKKIKCECGKEMTDSAFEYHRLRCESHKKDNSSPYPVTKMDSEEAEKILSQRCRSRSMGIQSEDGKWIKKLVYSCKIGETLKIPVPDHKEALRIRSLWIYYAKSRRLVGVVSIIKTWKGKDVFLSVSKRV